MDKCPYCNSTNIRGVYFEDEYGYVCDDCDRLIL